MFKNNNTDYKIKSWEYNVNNFMLAAECHVGRDEALVYSFRNCLDKLFQSGFGEEYNYTWLDLGSGSGSLVNKLISESSDVFTQFPHMPNRIEGIFIDNDLPTCSLLKKALGLVNQDHNWVKTVECKDAEIFVKEALLSNRKYSIVSAIHLFYYLKDWLTSIKTMQQLADKGCVFIAVKSGLTPFYKLMKKIYSRFGMTVPGPFFGEDLIRILDTYNFESLIKTPRSQIVLPKKDEDLLRLISFVWRLPKEIITTKKEEICTLVRNLECEYNGHIEFTDIHFILPGKVFSRRKTKR